MPTLPATVPFGKPPPGSSAGGGYFVGAHTMAGEGGGGGEQRGRILRRDVGSRGTIFENMLRRASVHGWPGGGRWARRIIRAIESNGDHPGALTAVGAVHIIMPMNRIFASLAPSLLLIGSPLQAQERRAEITWHTDLPAAKRLAAQERAPLFVVFRCEA